MHMLFLIFGLASYLALAIVLAAIAAAVIVSRSGGCPRLDEGAVECVSPFYADLGYFSLGVLLAAGFSGLPAILAVAGLVFLIRDLLHMRRARRI